MPRIKQTAPTQSNKQTHRLIPRDNQAPKATKAVALAKDETVHKKRRKRPGTGALLEIRRLQKNDRDIIPKSTFRKLLREVLGDAAGDGPLRMQGSAVRVLREMSAKYLHHIFVLGNALCVKENRMELNLKDYVMATNIISGDFQKSLDMPDASERLLHATSRPLRRPATQSDLKKTPATKGKKKEKLANQASGKREEDDTNSEETKCSDDEN
ncbi:histone H3 [Cymbomonas tetramitiformis]|uniref:Histone H3 n=1 Tax=Cymbomonas tetramitiformis TaxID=36881 RepID=A0AAE0C215_9CHLO|nr:histone H3 [Cymbomonas tetramitiformis]|eukprot:gene834-1311_t